MHLIQLTQHDYNCYYYLPHIPHILILRVIFLKYSSAFGCWFPQGILGLFKDFLYDLECTSCIIPSIKMKHQLARSRIAIVTALENSMCFSNTWFNVLQY
ncbi:hypothetical protein XELAEV_18022444mg [Xenopus laevis]|uniref:Uncharacterized protein n=1 Tax=Xenopus laevis TaxID=8355 RepID=A0A974HNP7_XENLA|nr:hypothetical protein XELAEV_18022444mg [Xenopus laevis]